MVCVLFGHRDAPYEIGSVLKEKISELSDKYGDVEFLVGNNGSFDYISQRALTELASENERIGFCIVLSYINEKPLIGQTAFTLFPDGQELVPRKFAISRRNDWLLCKADIVLCYVKHVGSNSRRLLEKAERRGAYIINIAH